MEHYSFVINIIFATYFVAS